MNGRVYDYNVGRFLSVDPFIHSGSQGINPYSYIMNNPLAGSDPSGYKPICDQGGEACEPENKDKREDGPEPELYKITVTKETKGDRRSASLSGRASKKSTSSFIVQVNNGAQNNSSEATTVGPPPPSIGSLSGTSFIKSNDFAFVDWRAYVNDEVSRTPIDHTIAEQLGLSVDDRFSNFDAIFGMWIKVNSHINSGNIPFAAALVAGRYGNLISRGQARGLLRTKVISPTYRELQGLNKGFEAHHILPQYLGKMLGYTKSQMMNHPATLIPKFKHTGALNPLSYHKAIDRYLRRGTQHTPGQIREGLKKAYGDLNKPELYNSINHLIK